MRKRKAMAGRRKGAKTRKGKGSKKEARKDSRKRAKQRTGKKSKKVPARRSAKAAGKKKSRPKAEQLEWKTKPLGGALTEPGNSLKYFTGTWKTTRPVTDYDKCIHCLKCVVYCPENCIKAKNDKKEHVEFHYCKGCGLCAQVCPVKCIKIVDEDEFKE